MAETANEMKKDSDDERSGLEDGKMSTKDQSKRKIICYEYPSAGVSCCLLTSGMLAFLLLFVNTILALDVNTFVPVLKYPVNETLNVSNSSFTNRLNLKETAGKVVETLKSWTVIKPRTTNRPNPKVTACQKDFRRNHLMTINLPGRTGNNLFQMATLIATAEATCYTAVRSPKKIDHLDGIFDLKNVEKRTFSASSCRILQEPGWSIFMENITSLISPEYNWTLAGYRQSYRYFQNYSNFIKSSFQFKESIRRDVIHYLENNTQVYKTLSVCMHIRRGDLVASRKYGSSRLSYINRAIDFYKIRLAPSNFSLVITSDDMKWCAANIKGNNTYFSPFKDVCTDSVRS